MIAFPFKRIFGLIGAPRAGKDRAAEFLQETRGFKPIAFADRIKEEFGITKADFETAKIAGNIDELRDALWAFSAEKKKENPSYFIDLVTQDALASMESTVITDIRTTEELVAVLSVGRVYWVRRGVQTEKDENGFLLGSRIQYEEMINKHNPYGWVENVPQTIRPIENNSEGLFGFLKDLAQLFFIEDVVDLSDSSPSRYPLNDKNETMISYMKQFEANSRKGKK